MVAVLPNSPASRSDYLTLQPLCGNILGGFNFVECSNMIDLINENELNIFFRPNRVVGLIRNITQNIFELLGIEQNIIVEPIRIMHPIAHVNVPELNIEPLNIEPRIIREQLFNPPAINPVLLDLLLKAEPKPKTEIEKTVDEIFRRRPNSAFSIAHIRPYKDATFYATETPGVFSNTSSFNV